MQVRVQFGGWGKGVGAVEDQAGNVRDYVELGIQVQVE